MPQQPSFQLNTATINRLNERLADATQDAANVLVDEARSIFGTGDTEQTDRGVVRSLPGEPPEVQSGELRDSVEVLEFDKGERGTFARVGTDLIKGWWLEFGAMNMEPRPWLRPAYERAKPAMFDQYKGIV